MTEPVHSITDAPQRHSEEQHARMVRYAIAMGIRLLCFVLAVLVRNWMTWVFLGLAVVLPYIAVTLANAGGDRYFHKRDVEPAVEPPQLPPGPEDASGSSGSGFVPGEVIEGEIMPDAGDDGRT